MDRLYKIIGLVLALTIIFGIGYFAYLLMTANNQTRIAVLTAAVSVATIVYTQNLTSKREIAARQFTKKSEAYEEIMATIGMLSTATRKSQSVDEEELVDRLAQVMPKLMVWAGPEVILAWKRMCIPKDDPIDALQSGAELIAALRSELGHSDGTSLGPFGAMSAMLKYDKDGNVV